MRTIKITPELKVAVDEIYRVDYADKIESLKQTLSCNIEASEFNDIDVKAFLVYLSENLDTLIRLTPAEMTSFLDENTLSYKETLVKSIKEIKDDDEKIISFGKWLEEVFDIMDSGIKLDKK